MSPTANRESGKWTYATALEMIQRNGVRPIEKEILLDRHDHPGIKVWGAIDFLAHYCGFTVRRDS